MKPALKIVGYAIAFVISSIILLALLVDANMFKPRITALAQERGIALDMRGDLHWAFWPSIGLAVQELSIASTATPAAPIADIQEASFLMAFFPLMQGNFEVKHIRINGAVINLEVDAEGKGNWESLIKSQEASVNADPRRKNTAGSVKSSDLHLSIEQISLHDSAITYSDQRKHQRIRLSDMQLDIDNVNTRQEPFAMDFSWIAQISDEQKNNDNKKPLTLKGKLHQRVALGDGFSTILLSDGDLKLDLEEQSAASIAINYAAKIARGKDTWQYKGNIALPAINAKTLLAAFGTQLKTANEKALSNLSIKAEMDGDLTQLSFKNVSMELDKTNMTGNISIADFASQAITMNLQGDHINVDDYLAPSPATSTAATTNQPAVDAPLPLALLRELNVNIKASFNNMVFSQLALEKVQLDINANRGTIQQELSANAYSGSIHEKMTMDVQPTTANARFETIVRGLQIEPVLKAKKLDKSLHLSGVIEANGSGHAKGASTAQLMQSLTGSGQFAGIKVRLAPINIEQKFCEMVNLIGRTEAPAKTWPDYTELRELTGKISIAQQIISVEQLTAGVEKLQVGTQGTINLGSGGYDFRLPIKINRDANDTPTSITTSANGCTVNSNYWAERSMTLLRCKGIYAEINPAKDCRPDKDMLAAVVKDYAEYKLREKHGAKLESKKAELIQKLDDKLGGEEKTEKAKAILKDIFKKQNDE